MVRCEDVESDVFLYGSERQRYQCMLLLSIRVSWSVRLVDVMQIRMINLICSLVTVDGFEWKG